MKGLLKCPQTTQPSKCVITYGFKLGFCIPLFVLRDQSEKIYCVTLWWTNIARKGLIGIKKRELIPLWESWVQVWFWRWEYFKWFIISWIYCCKEVKDGIFISKVSRVADRTDIGKVYATPQLSHLVWPKAHKKVLLRRLELLSLISREHTIESYLFPSSLLQFRIPNKSWRHASNACKKYASMKRIKEG